MNYLKHLLFVGIVLTTVYIAPLASAQVQPGSNTAANSSTADAICKGVLSADDSGRFVPDATLESCHENGEESFGFLVRQVINLLSVVAGAVSVIMIIIGGFRYVISGGDSTSVSGAKNTILYAIVGLLVVLFAHVIIRFVLENVSTT